MPTLSNLEIEGRHPQADGIRIVGVMQATLTGVLVHGVRTAVHVTGRARNLLISHCHFYHNNGIGQHLDQVNLGECSHALPAAGSQPAAPPDDPEDEAGNAGGVAQLPHGRMGPRRILQGRWA
jgi:hypothetical protein